MDLIHTDYPEGYRVLYNIETHAFEFLIKSDLFDALRRRIAQHGSLLIGNDVETEPFSNDAESWGYGGCLTTQDTFQNPLTILCGQIQPLDESNQARSNRTTNNLACSIAILLEELNRFIYYEDSLHAVAPVSIQLATIQTMIRDDASHWNCSIGSSLSKNGRRSIERILASTKEDRMFFFENIILAMKDAFSRLDRPPSRHAHLETNTFGASFDLLSTRVIQSWRIQIECVGASIGVSPVYDQAGEDRGAQWEPHNVDTPTLQLTLLAGLATCYQQLYQI